MSFLSQQFENQTTSENKENRVNKVIRQKSMQTHYDNISYAPTTKPDVSANNKNKMYYTNIRNNLHNTTTENSASERK